MCLSTLLFTLSTDLWFINVDCILLVTGEFSNSPVTKRVSFSTEHVSGLVTNVECTIANKRAFSNDCTVVNPKDEQSAIEGLLEKSLPESQKHTCAVLLHKLGFPVTRSALDKLVRIEDSLEERRRTAIRNVLDDDSLSLAQKHARSVRLHKAGKPMTDNDLRELVGIEEYLEFGPVER